MYRRYSYYLLAFILTFFISSATTSLILVRNANQVVCTLPTEMLPNMAEITGDTFIMGRDKGDDLSQPAHTVEVHSFKIAKSLVTNRQYAAFVQDTGYRSPQHWAGNQPTEDLDMPVVNVSWEDATTYCQWLTKRTGINYHLPTEVEWEYVARKDNTNTGVKILTPTIATMGICAGAKDTKLLKIGKLEWTGSAFEPYPGHQMPIEFKGKPVKVFRGEGEEDGEADTFRSPQYKCFSADTLGFRVAIDR